ncbi:hypothetical protein BDP27DRAFT_1335458 [Rhodocollybia butyracea]|uniref:Uncharacterized protein n=1 Tax=Rhodocollybia butyracea TaxID=206335 RepID=A0A9P5U316_9AGAR|nr:hypothetical protein BDP27DRAFT_1335458 [Rhodocollybia butyracea]
MPNSDSIPDLGGADDQSFWVGSYEREQDRERKGEGEGGLSSGKLDVPGRSPSGQVEIPSSRSSSSNETERERGRAGGEWGMFDVQDDSSAVAHNNFGSANPGAAVPLTRMFLKRSLSEPAAPRPTRPRLEEGVEFAGAGGAAEFGWTGNYHEEDPDHHATIYPQPHQVLNLPGSSTFTRHHTYPAPSGGAELAYHHSFSYPNQHPNTNPNLNPQEAGYPGPGEPVIHRLHVPPASAWITPRAQVLGSPGTEASSPSPTPSSTGSPMTAYTAVPLSRSNSTSSPSVPLSAPLPFPSDTSATATASLQPHPRRRAWTTRSNPGPEKTPPMFLSPAAASGSGSAAAHNNVDPTKYGGYQRPMSRASLPPLSPTSPADHAHSHVSNLGNLGNSGRNVSFFSRPTHRKTLTWGERWTTPPQSDSPAPAPSLPPLMTTTPEISETVPGYGFTWQQVETQRRMELDYGEEGDENARSAGGMKERKEVDTQRLMSTERMGWQQDTGEEVPLMWRVPQRPPSPGPELVGYSSTENADSVSLNSSSKLSWSPANAGYTGYVASILDPHLPNPNIDSGQNHLVEAQAHPNESVPPSHFAQVPSSSYSTLSGWAGTESSKEPRVPQHEGAIGHPVMMVPPNSYSSSFFDRSKERQGEWDTISNTTLYPFDSSGASRTHGWDPSSSS